MIGKIKGIFYEKILPGNRAGEVANCTKIKQSEISLDMLDKNDGLGFYRFTEYVRIHCQNNDCQFRQVLSTSDVLPSGCKINYLKIQNVTVRSPGFNTIGTFFAFLELERSING